MSDVITRCWTTPLLDLTATPAVHTIVPAKPGYIVTVAKVGFVVKATSGTPTADVVASIGDNTASFDNVKASANFPAQADMTAIKSITDPGLVTAQTRHSGAGLSVNITQAAAGTGGFTLTGYYFAIASYAPAGI
jgi:hypothetical protein